MRATSAVSCFFFMSWHGSSRAGVLGDVTYRVVLRGPAQHDAYHTGQIALLKRIYRDTAAS